MSEQEVQEEVAQPKARVGQRYINGAVSGLIEVTLTHWIDVIKTRLQAEKEITKGINVSSLSRRIWAEEGFRGFYRGYISRMAGIGPMRAIFWGTMDVVRIPSSCFASFKFRRSDRLLFRLTLYLSASLSLLLAANQLQATPYAGFQPIQKRRRT